VNNIRKSVKIPLHFNCVTTLPCEILGTFLTSSIQRTFCASVSLCQCLSTLQNLR